MMHTAESYASEWATLTGRSESEIYVPVALRPFVLEVGARVREVNETGLIREVKQSGLLVVEWSDGEESTEYPDAFDGNGVLL